MGTLTNTRKTKKLNNFLVNVEILLERYGRPRLWLSEQIGMSASTVTNWWGRNSFPTVEYACDIAKLFGVSVEDLVYGDMSSITPSKRSYKAIVDKDLISIITSLDEDEASAVIRIVKSILDFKRKGK